MTTKADWVEVGRRLREAREELDISARAAAKQASISATYWQDMERGFRLDGGRVNPSGQKLEAAALVVGLDPAPLFELVGRSYTEPKRPAGSDRLAVVERRLDATEAELREVRDALREVRDALLAGESRP